MLDEQIRKDIRIILDYLWHDEEKHYFESEYSKNHIFRIMKRLAKIIKYEL